MQNWLCRFLIIVGCLLGKAGIIFAQSADYQFARYSAEKGLSHNQVNCFLKDRQGFVWIGTADGLNRFDGYSFRIFKHDPADSTTLADHHINELFEDPDGYIWIRTREGYNIYDPATERIEKDANRAARRLGLPDADFNRIIKTKKGDYWISHNRLGLLKYQPSGKFLLRVTFKREREANSQEATPAIADFNEDSLGNLWVVYNDGFLLRLDANTYKSSYRSNLLQNKKLGNSVNYRVFADGDGEPWVYIIKAVQGAFYFDTKKNELISANTFAPVFKLTNNIVGAITSGPDGRIWIGTDHGGINIVDKKSRSVSVLQYNPDDQKTISQNSILALYKDTSGMIWAGDF